MSLTDKPLYFVLPEDRHLPSGGNRYNEQLIRALIDAGRAVDMMSFSAYHTAIQQDKPGSYWVDSLLVQDMKSLSGVNTVHARSFFIVHHLESLHPPPDTSSEALFKAQEQQVLSFFDGFLVTSTFSEKYLRDRGFQQPIIVLEPALDIPILKRTSQRKQVQALMVANVINRKGILNWLEALGRWTLPADQFSLHIIGSTDMEADYATSCRQEVASHPALRARVHFTGALPHKEVLHHYINANLFISAAHMETYGMALQEARAYQLPILTVTGGFAENHVSPGENGYIFNSADEMAKFFIDLTRDRAKFIILQEQTLREQRTVYTWQQAAALFFQQFHSYF